MSYKITDFIKVDSEQDSFEVIKQEIEDGIRFSGSNFWILITAIFVASIGLNVNSTAVVIGAMLISPLMGPIIGIGFGVSTNDLRLLKRSGLNYLFATVASLATSSLYFFFSPLDDSHAELLARTSPNIYDVFIAVFGGFAGIIALSRKNKANVIPGVAIATALMPPLCTAGYGIATGQYIFIFGALYLYVINSVFIALSTYAFTRIKKFPIVKLEDKKEHKRVSRIIISLTIITLVPSIYLGYDMIIKNKFNRNATNFIQKEISDEGVFVLRRQINPSKKVIEVFLLVKKFDSLQINSLKKRLVYYNIADAELILNTGFTESAKATELKQNKKLKNLEYEVYQLNSELDSVLQQKKKLSMITDELTLLFEEIEDVYFNMPIIGHKKILVKLKQEDSKLFEAKDGIKKWLQNKLETDSIEVNIL